MMKILKAVVHVLTPRERKRGILILGMAVALGFLETAGVASIMPFLAVVGNPQIIQRVGPVAWLYETLGFTSVNAFMLAMGSMAVGMLVFTTAFKLLTSWAQLRFVSMRRHSLSHRLLRSFLGQPYAFFLNRNSADIAKGILSESSEVINQVLKPGIEMISNGIIAVVLIAFLIYMNPLMALAVAGVLGGGYVATYMAIRGLTLRQGRERVAANHARFKVINEAFGGIKEVKLRSLEDYFLKSFDVPSKVFARTQSTNAILSQVPKYIIEAIAFGAVIGITLYLLATRKEMGYVLPVIGAYALAGYRLLPALQNVYKGLVTLRFGMGALESLVDDLQHESTVSANTPGTAAPQFEHSISLDDVSLTYAGSQSSALTGLSLEIPINTTVGFVGHTGAGKSTLVDIVLGLLQPTTGAVCVDGKRLDSDNIAGWQQMIGYVPQAIYLSDDSIGANIAFGIVSGRIDHQSVERAARAAQLHEFIEQLPQGYATQIGERGVRLSGGQRQRVGIARALYSDPRVLVLDEGTSALDNVTEAAVMEAVRALSHQKTIILIAHRLSTLKDCDQIFVLESGKLKGKGTLEQLQQDNEIFRRFSGLSEVPPIAAASG